MLVASEMQRRYKKSGLEVSNAVEAMVANLKESTNLNITLNKNYANGYPGMEKQFKMDFCIVFHDFNDTQWLLKTTSSIRDRIYGTEFFAQNIQIIDSEDKKVERIYVVVPDSISEAEQANAMRYSQKVNSKKYKSFLSDVITISKLRELILEKCMVDISQGVLSNIIGKDAEKMVMQLLNEKSNWHLWNNFESCKHEEKSDSFPWFKIILSGIGFEPSIGYKESKDKVVMIDATDKIPSLDGGGSPKTDVSFTVTFDNEHTVTHNITVKKTSKDRVTVHEGQVTDLIMALQIDPDDELAKALTAFQDCGSVKKFNEQGQEHLVDVLCNKLPSYNRKLVEFAIFGVNNPRITHPIQVADSILFKNMPNADNFWLRENYVNYYIRTYSSKGQFGTPFQWTYPSGKRGKSIQLKVFTNN